jgi:N4-gp56 family major capsid protein
MPSQINIAGTTSGDFIKLDNVLLDVYTKEILFKAQPNLRFESVAIKKTDLQAQPGNTLKFLRYNSLSGKDTLAETDTIVTDVLSTNTVAITVAEKAKALQFSEFLLRTAITDVLSDAAMLLGMHYAKNRDALIRDALMAGANVKYSQAGGAATSRANLNAGSVFDVNLIRDAVEFLATNKAPKFGDAYVCFVHPHQARFLRADGAWVNVQNYASPENMLTGEIGRIEDVRFIETTMVQYIKKSTQDIWADGEDTGDNTTIAANTATDVYRACVVGDYSVGLAEGLPVEMRDNGVQDFGRKHSLAYYGIWGAGLIETGHSLILETA